MTTAISTNPTTGLLGEIRDLLRAQTGSTSSVQIETNSRGTTFSVKAYASTPAEAGAAAQTEYERLRVAYGAQP